MDSKGLKVSGWQAELALGAGAGPGAWTEPGDFVCTWSPVAEAAGTEVLASLAPGAAAHSSRAGDASTSASVSEKDGVT